MDGERFGAGEAELLEEVDSWGGRSVGVAVEFLMGGSGGRPRCVCKRKNAMRSGALLWRDSRYIHVHAYVHLRMYLHADRTVRPKKLASFEPGSSFNL